MSKFTITQFFYEGGNIQDMHLSGCAHALWVWWALGCLFGSKLDDIITVNLETLSRGCVCAQVACRFC